MNSYELEFAGLIGQEVTEGGSQLGYFMKILVIRLSSLGDLILSTSGLKALDHAHEVHWLVAGEFAGLLHGHPRVARVIPFSRRSEGLLSWIMLGIQLRREGFDQVVDLHRTFRTLIFRLLFIGVNWRGIKKPRWRRWGLFIFKRYWPEGWGPRRWAENFSRVLSGSDAGKPDFRFLVSASGGGSSEPSGYNLGSLESGRYYYAIMPDSAWSGKCWPVDSYLALAESLKGGVPVVLGTKKDQRAAFLLEQLDMRGLNYRDARGLSWAQVASCLAQCVFLVGNDTGLTHFAEAVGTPVVVIFGPTSPLLGFAPLGPMSRVVESRVFCRPCSSDGRVCYWSGEKRYQCLTGVSVEQVRGVCLEVIRTAPGLLGVNLT